MYILNIYTQFEENIYTYKITSLFKMTMNKFRQAVSSHICLSPFFFSFTLNILLKYLNTSSYGHCLIPYRSYHYIFDAWWSRKLKFFSHSQKASDTFHVLPRISSDLTPRLSLKKTATQLCVQKKAVTRTSTILKTSASCTQLTHWPLCWLTENKDWRVYIYSYATGSHLRKQVEVCLKNIFEITKSFINCISMYFED